MEKETIDFLIAKATELKDAYSCSIEAKNAAEKFINEAECGRADEAIDEFLEELEEDITPIDNLIDFVGSEEGASYFGSERAKEMLEHAKSLKAQNALYCDCPACKACEEILMKMDE